MWQQPAGVSIATVSNVVNGTGKVGRATTGMPEPSPESPELSSDDIE